MTVTTRALAEDEWLEWRSLRLAALASDPHAFGSTLAEWSGPADVEPRWRQRLTTVPFNLLAELGGEPVGMVSARDVGEGMVELLSLWVAPRARGRGAGDALVSAVLAWARAQGATRVGLDVHAANATATALYLRHGFQDAGASSDPGDARPERRMVAVLLPDA